VGSSVDFVQRERERERERERTDPVARGEFSAAPLVGVELAIEEKKTDQDAKNEKEGTRRKINEEEWREKAAQRLLPSRKLLCWTAMWKGLVGSSVT